MKKSTKKRKIRTELRNGCSRTEVFISPENFNTLRNKSDLKKDWFVECRFHDPKFIGKYPNGFQYRKRLNAFDNLKDRKEAAVTFKEIMEIELDAKNYNPITKMFMSSSGSELHPNLDFSTAIDQGRLKLVGSEKHLNEVRIALTRFRKGLDELNYSCLNIKDVEIWHIMNTLDHIKLTPSYFNKFRQYLLDVFKILIKYGCIKHNPVREISKNKIVPQLREVLTDEQLKFIDPYLKENYYSFYRYRMIFGYSGGRTSELFRVQKKHVDIKNQEYKVMIKKGPSYVWTTKIIMLDAVPFWTEILNLTEDPEDYLFAKGLVPGAKPILPYQITKRWDRLIKKTDNIKDENGKVIKVTADFYTLKHKLLDELDALQDTAPIIPIDNPARILASHRSNETTGIYAHGRIARKNEHLKKIRFGT